MKPAIQEPLRPGQHVFLPPRGRKQTSGRAIVVSIRGKEIEVRPLPRHRKTEWYLMEEIKPDHARNTQHEIIRKARNSK